MLNNLQQFLKIFETATTPTNVSNTKKSEDFQKAIKRAYDIAKSQIFLLKSPQLTVQISIQKLNIKIITL